MPRPPLPLKLSAVTSHSRFSVVAELTAALNALGSVLDSHPFSNLALAVHFEISPGNLAKLRPALLALPLSLSDASLEALAAVEALPPGELPPDLPGSLNITFVHSDPDYRMPIPAVPG